MYCGLVMYSNQGTAPTGATNKHTKGGKNKAQSLVGFRRLELNIHKEVGGAIGRLSLYWNDCDDWDDS